MLSGYTFDDHYRNNGIPLNAIVIGFRVYEFNNELDKQMFYYFWNF